MTCYSADWAYETERTVSAGVSSQAIPLGDGGELRGVVSAIYVVLRVAPSGENGGGGGGGIPDALGRQPAGGSGDPESGA